ncbi:MAG: indole-3-glycerol-phosphate synthase [Deltaproteobacteria bacterium]|nr:indole-3-glycerol-phosphate synthase [Deltaproteobacteria bacterium]
MSVLEQIVARTRADLAERRRVVPAAALEATLRPRAPGRFSAALSPRPAVAPANLDRRASGPRAPLALIAEVKPRSPSRGALCALERVPEVVEVYSRHAQAISVLCDAPHFGGGYPLLASVRAQTDLPILAKDFVVDRYQLLEARAAGADAVLLMAAVVSPAELGRLLEAASALGLDALVEAHDADELAISLASGARVIGVNSRDLKTLHIDAERARGLLATVGPDRIRVAESGVTSVEDVRRLSGCADAALVGSALVSADDLEAKIEALGW